MKGKLLSELLVNQEVGSQQVIQYSKQTVAKWFPNLIHPKIHW